MKKTAILFILSALFTFAFAGTTAGAFLKTGIGAKAAGLGRSYSVSVSDPSALYWNPAGLAKMNGERKVVKKVEVDAGDFDDEFQQELEESIGEDFAATESQNPESTVEVIERGFEMRLFTTYSMLAGDRDLGMAALAFTGPGGTYGLGVLGTQVRGITGYDETGAATGDLAYNAYAGYLGFGSALRDGGIRYGFSLMGMQETIDTSSVTGGGLNAGIQISAIPFVFLGASVQNLAGIVAVRSDNTEKYEKLDTILNLGMGIDVPNADVRVHMGVQSNFDEPEDEPILPSAGVSLGIAPMTYIMAGMTGSRPSAGLGFSSQYFKFAYSVNTEAIEGEVQHMAEIEVGF